MKIHLNVPLQSPNQIRHDIITHNMVPIDIQNIILEKEQLEEEGDEESTSGNLKAIAREGDLSPTLGNKSGRKGKKQGLIKEIQLPKRVLPKRAVLQPR